MVAQNNIRRN